MTKTAAEKEQEREANAFAMELLMPTAFLQAELAKMGGIDIEDNEKLAALAKRFRVSQQVMTIRLAKFMDL
jgi:Zn-dependent peptidase ImmA (M78 family)